jgi:hypothetical protein
VVIDAGEGETSRRNRDRAATLVPAVG